MSETTIHLNRFEDTAKGLVAAAQSMADNRHHRQVEPLHLLAQAVEQSEVAKVLRQFSIDTSVLTSTIESMMGRLARSSDGSLSYLSASMTDLLNRAEKEAGEETVRMDHLLNALAQESRGFASQVLQQFSISPATFRSAPSLKQGTPSTLSGNTFTRDLIARADSFGPCVARDGEVRRLLQILGRSNQNNPLLIGELGAGKTAIVNEIAKRFSTHEVPLSIAKHAFVEVELSALTSGAASRGVIEGRVKQYLNDFKQNNQNVILLIDGLENLFHQNPTLNVSDLFKTLLSRDEIRIFGTSTPAGLRKLMEKDASFARYFTTLTIDVLTPDQSIEVLRATSPRLEKYHGVSISDVAIRASVGLSKRYIQDRVLPDSALSVLDSAAATKRLEANGLPAVLDSDVRKLESLKAQAAKLASDSDTVSLKTLQQINSAIADLEPRVNEVRSSLLAHRSAFQSRNTLRAQYQKAQEELESVRKRQDFKRLGEIEYGIIPSLTAKLEEVENTISRGGFRDVSNVIGEAEVADVIAEQTGVPVAKMLEGETQKLLMMEERLTKRVVGQDEAVKSLAKAVRRARVGLRNPRKPVGSFLFLGASGCGKTETAKALAEFLFDDDQAMTRIDCSEMMEKHNAQRLIGSPNGYVGSEEGGQLTEAIKSRPYSVLLFDEVEKAHPDVFNLLLQVLDDGHLSDARGQSADFSNCVVIMTSNLGSRKLLDVNDDMFESKEGREALREMMLGEMKAFLRPEFINRIDDILIFKPLSKINLRGIVDIELRKVEKLVAEREFKLDLTEEAKQELVEISYEPSFGARPLTRSIVDKIQNPLAEAILHKGFKDGSVIKVALDNHDFIFST